MNIEDIPGFEKTPDEINCCADVDKIYNIIDKIELKFTDDIPLIRKAKVYEKLLDDRRKLLENNIKLIKAIWHDEINDMNYWKDFVKISIELIEEVTEKTWEELNNV